MTTSKKFKFAFVSNSSEIANAVRAYATQESIEIETHLETMESALPVARRLLDSGVDVILGGGATGNYLRQTLDLPVVTIARTHLDVLRALIQAKKIGSYIGLTSYASRPEGLDVFEELLHVRIRPLVFHSTTELVEGIAGAVTDGVHCFVGGGICRELASSHGKTGILITPSSEVILRALEEAKAIASSQRKEREKAERLRIILESVTEGIIGIDKQRRIDVLNRPAALKLGLDQNKALGQPLPDIVRGTGLIRTLRTGEAEEDHIRTIAGTEVVISSRPIEVDGKIEAAVATFRLASRIQNIDRKLKEKLYAKGFSPRYSLDNLKGDSPCMVHLKDKAARYARTDASLLIQGETGTGKEILAQSIHVLSSRRSKPFVAINCAALPESLLESELFGHEEGAFTGAKRGGKMGLFELANEGTIFLDEIADIPKSLQVRLLRVLEEKEVMRIGGDKITPVDVRIISSTYKNLPREVSNGTFRSDLYFRLSVLHLIIPPLRERLDDIPAIAREIFSRQGVNGQVLSDKGLGKLMEYPWPGNIRELDALLRRYALLLENHAANDRLLVELLEELQDQSALFTLNKPSSPATPIAATTGTLKEAVDEFETQVIDRVLRESRFNKTEAARKLGISVNTLWRRLKE